MKRGSRKGLILKAATDLFSQHPYHRVSMEDVARKARVAKGTVYYYFPSKEALYAALLHEGLNNMLKRLKGRFTEDNPVENIKEFVTEMVNFFSENRDFFLVLQKEERNLFSKKLEDCYKEFCTIRDILERLIDEAKTKKQVRDDIATPLLTDMIMGMIKVPIIHKPLHPSEHAEAIVKTLYRGILYNAESKSP